MAIVSRSTAESIASKMLVDKQEHVNKLKIDFHKKLIEEIVKTLPKEVQEFYKKFPKYTNTRTRFDISGDGWEYKSIHPGEYPSGPNLPTLSSEVKIALKVDFDNYEKSRDEYNQLRSKLIEALVGLKTHKRIIEFLPEAEPFLEKALPKMAIAINFANLRKELK